MAVLTNGSKFPEKVVADIFSTVKGKSTLARFSGNVPIPFSGGTIFTFSLDKDVALVGENEAKSEGGATVAPIHCPALKVEYGARVTDEFINCSEDEQLSLLESFKDGFAKKLAAGLDKMAMHQLNPRSNAKSTLIKTYIDQTANTVTQGSKSAGEALDDAVATLGDYDVTGIALTKGFASEVANATDAAGNKLFPDFKAWGKVNSDLNGVDVDINNTVGAGTPADKAIVGDFDMFKWGYAKNIELEIIPYGDPDNTGVDLKGNNQVYLRCEAYIGFGVLDPNAFAVVRA